MTTINEIVQRVKAHPGIVGADVVNLADNDFAFAVAQVIHSALRELVEQDAANSTTRPYHITDPAVVKVTLDAAGQGNLEPLTIDHGVMLELLHFGEITHEDWDSPLTFVRHSAAGRMPSNYADFHARYWLVGKTIHARANNEPLPGDLFFAVPCVQGLNTLSPHRTTKLVDLVVARLRGVPVPKENK